MSDQLAGGEPETEEDDREQRLVSVWGRTLATAGVPLTTEGLVAALSSPRLDIRAGAALILGRRGENSAIPHLALLLQDEFPLVRVEVAMSLALLGDKSGLPALIQLLDEPLVTGSPVTAASYLADLGDRRGYRIVLKALVSELAGIRLSAAVALKSFLPYHGTVINGERIDLVATIERALEDNDPLVRRELLHKLAQLNDPRVLPILSRVHDSDTDESVRRIAQALLSRKPGGGTRQNPEGWHQ